MINFIGSIFKWLIDVLRPAVDGLRKSLDLLRWVIVAIVAALLVPIKSLLEFLLWLTQLLHDQTESLLEFVQNLHLDSANTYWMQLSQGAALANCLMPLDFAVHLFNYSLTGLVVAIVVKVILTIYRLWPAKAT